MDSDSPAPPPAPDEPQPPEAAPQPVAIGCALLFALAFVIAGLLPFLALLDVFPRDEYFGGQPVFPILAASLGFIAVGVYLMVTFLRAALGLPRTLGRVFALIVAFSLAVPFHWWLFFGEAAEVSVAGITLPGGFTVFSTAYQLLNFIVAKVVVAVVCVILDLVLISEVFGLGWFTWRSGG